MTGGEGEVGDGGGGLVSQITGATLLSAFTCDNHCESNLTAGSKKKERKKKI